MMLQPMLESSIQSRDVAMMSRNETANDSSVPINDSYESQMLNRDCFERRQAF